MSVELRSSRPRHVGAALLLAALCSALCSALAAPADAQAESETPPETEVTWLKTAPRTEKGRFVNPIGPLPHGSGGRFPFFWRRMQATLWPRKGAAEARASAREDFLNRSEKSPWVTWVGHATLLIEMSGVRFLTDPIWSKRASPISWIGPTRLRDPGLAWDDLPDIDFVLISHNHFDHLDRPTLRRLAERNPDAIFYVPLGNGQLLRKDGIENVVELDWTQKTNFGPLEIVCLPAQHWSKRGLRDNNAALWSSWAVLGPSRRFFFAGDTAYFSGFTEIGEQYGPFDLAAVPIGAYRPVDMMKATHMNPEQAYQAALDLQAQKALAIHFGTFDLADEPLDEPPQRFMEAGAEAQPGESETWVFSLGEIRPF